MPAASLSLPPQTQWTQETRTLCPARSCQWSLLVRISLSLCSISPTLSIFTVPHVHHDSSHQVTKSGNSRAKKLHLRGFFYEIETTKTILYHHCLVQPASYPHCRDFTYDCSFCLQCLQPGIKTLGQLHLLPDISPQWKAEVVRGSVELRHCAVTQWGQGGRVYEEGSTFLWKY